jgi:hypothetical protein
MHMTKTLTSVLAVTLGLSLLGCAHTEEPKAELPKNVERSQLLTAKATVVDINQVTRLVTLKGEDGKVVRFRAGLDVQNLPQVSVGDVVTVQYYESLMMRVLDPHEASVNTSGTDAARAQPGEMPGAAVAQQQTVTVTILSTDKTAGTATFTLPSGEVMTVRAADPKNLDLIKENDRVSVTYTEAMGIKVEKAQ